jgi:two-component system cell cycle response regulator DivK
MPTILVVEDNELNMKLVVDTLTAQGCQILEARSGEQCLKILETARPDLILMDIHLPGINGIETLGEIKKIPALVNIPILAVTASVMNSDRQKTLKAGFDSFIDKPIDLKSFISTIQEFLLGSK